MKLVAPNYIILNFNAPLSILNYRKRKLLFKNACLQAEIMNIKDILEQRRKEATLFCERHMLDLYKDKVKNSLQQGSTRYFNHWGLGIT